MNSNVDSPLISIITVVLNGVKTIEGTINSVVSQKFDNYEYIIIDGKSTDGTIEIIEKYISKLAVFISEPDAGLYDAMNKAVSRARGRFVLFLGADDILLVSFKKLEIWLKDIDTIYYGNVYRPKLGRTYDGQFTQYKLACRNICHQSLFYPRHILEKNLFGSKHKIFADYELNLQCYFALKIPFKYIPESIAVFNDTGGMSHNKYDNQFELRKLNILKNHSSTILYFFIYSRYVLINILKKVGLLQSATKLVHRVRYF